jgi:hypothetical protein
MKRQETTDAMTLVNSPRAERLTRFRKAVALAFILALALVPLLGRRTPFDRLRGVIEKAQASTSGGSLPALQGEAAINRLKEQKLYGSLQEAVTAARYGFYQEPKRSADWLAENPTQRLRARFTPDGLHVETQSFAAQSHRLGMKLRSAGYGKRQIAASAGRLTAKGPRAEIRHELRQSVITEWYHNTAAGLEQGFTLESAPGERLDGERLRVALALDGDLRAELADGGRALEFKDDTGRLALRYDHLTVRDAKGRELEARMATPEQDGEVWLEVDDRKAAWPVTIDPTFTQKQKLYAPDGAEGDHFGASLAIDGDTVVIGAPFDGDPAHYWRGSVYIFARAGGVWIEQGKLVSSDGESEDFFGDSVAISGDTIVVGAPGDDGPTSSQRGSAYVFVRSNGTWNVQQKLFATGASENATVGASVAISGDTVVVGAPGDDGPVGAYQGSAFVFARASGVWTQQQKFIPSDNEDNDHFGESVAVSGDTVVVGAPYDDGGAGNSHRGSAYVFVRSNGVWAEQQRLLASDGDSGDFFGSVAINGDTIVVGAPGDNGLAGANQGSAYVFVRGNGVWTQQQKILASDSVAYDYFGASVAISGDTVVINAPCEDDLIGNFRGAAYVFSRSGGFWTEQQRFQGSDWAVEDRFSQVAISGNTILAGKSADAGPGGDYQGSAYVFASPAPPSITAMKVGRILGRPASIVTIAMVSDAEDAPNTLTVTVNGAASAIVNGVTVSSISIDASGHVTALVGTTCKASNATFTLRVTDSSGLSMDAELEVTTFFAGLCRN